MKNNRWKALPAAGLLLLFVVGQAFSMTTAQQATPPPAQGTGSAEQGKPAAEKTNTPAEKTGKQGEGTKAEPAKRESGQRKPAEQRPAEQRPAEPKNPDTRNRGNTYTVPADGPTENPTVIPYTPTGNANRDIQALSERVAALEKQLPPPQEPWDWLQWLLAGLLTAAAVVGLVFGYSHLRKRREQAQAHMAANFKGIRSHQQTVAERVKQLEDVSKNLSQQLAQQKAELSGLKHPSRAASFVPPEPVSAYHQPAEAPRFPVMIDDYLARVRGRAIPVKYDHKEKLLVEDGEREGNLLVVRDDMEPDALYLVPSFGFFQKKSDYTTYFENYYNCSRPVSGSVWIRQPAMVIRVNGGWQLEQLGELEVK